MSKETKNRFAVIPASAFKKGAKPQQIALLAAFSILADEKGFIKTNYSTLCDLINVSKGWITSNLRKLIELNLIKKHDNNVFSIVNDEDFVQSSEQDLVRTNLVNNNIYNNIYTPPKPKRSKTHLPDDFTPRDEDIEYASNSQGKIQFDNSRIELETEKFKNHHTAKASLFIDWHAAWRNWMIAAKGYDKNARGLQRKPTPADHASHIMQAAERAEQLFAATPDEPE